MIPTIQSAKQAAASLPSWLMDHKLVRAVLSDREREIEAQRQEEAKKLALAITELNRLHNEKEKRLAAAKAEFEDLERKRKEAVERHAVSMADASQKCSTVERTIEDLQKSLEKSCDPAIGETIEFFRDKLADFRHPRALKRGTVKKGLKNPANFRQEVVRSSNQRAIEVAIDYCKASMSELEEMKFMPKCDLAKIENLRRDLPSIDEYVITETYEHCPE